MKKYKIIALIVLTLWLMPLISYGEGTPPVAAFTFTQSVFQQSEPIEVNDTSYVSDGGKILKHEWSCTIKGKKVTSSSIKSLLKNAPVGEYVVSLRIKDQKGTWSQAVSQKVSLIANKPMKLTTFTSLRATYNIGEKLSLNYTYDNPNDLEVTGQRWRYKNLTTGSQTVSGKPRYFKKAGVYEITLELQDEWGNWSNKVSCKVKVTSQVTERNGYYLFEKGTPGDLIQGYVDKDYNQFEEAQVLEMTETKGTLIMSNSPETIYSSGILYQDTVSGRGRLILHHVNGTQYAKKLLVTVTNPSNESVKLTLLEQAVKGPGKHIMQLGQSALVQYFKGTSNKVYTIAPGQTICIYSSMGSSTWKHQEVITGTMDFESTGKLAFKVAALDETSAMENISKLQILSRDNHDRGTFNIIGRQYTLDLNNVTELKKLVLGREKEEWLTGIDATTGKEAVNRGNYGLAIKITIKNNEDMGVIINARGGAYLGALKWNNQKVFKVPNEQVLKDQKIAALAGCIKAQTSNEIVYMLPNGSSAPILFGFIPKSAWK